MNLFNSLERRVVKAKSSPGETDRLIAEYQPFIAKTVREHLGRFTPQTDSDEYSTALSAFHEALTAYDPAKGKFLPFASGVIRRRLIDLYRRQHRAPRTVSIEGAAEEDSRDITADASRRAYEAETEASQRRYEILAFTEALQRHGITFQQLAAHSPRQAALRGQYHGIVRLIMADDGLKTQILDTGRLPMKALETQGGLDRKRLDRGRIYILSCVLILSGDYPYLKEYIEWK